jgi:hypothetical protein
MTRLLLALALLAPSGLAATWYAAGDGAATNGTYAQPWGVQYAVTNSNPHLAAGDTVIFKNGSYTCVETNVAAGIAPCLELRKSGTAGNKITYRPESLWGFTFNGGVTIYHASNIVFRDFIVSWSGSTDRTRDNQYTHPAGISEYTTGNHIIHNLVSNSGHPGIGSWKTTQGKYIAGNVIRFAGQFDNVVGGVDVGSGMYLQNAQDSDEALIHGNISYFNNTTGMKAYGNTDIWGFNFTRNIVAHCNEAGLFYHQDNTGSEGLTFDRNYVWEGTTGLRLGYPLGNGGHTGAVVTDNYIVEDTASAPLYVADGWTGMVYARNTAVNLGSGYVWALERSGELNGDVASHTINSNTYWQATAGNAFHIKETVKTFAQWKADTTEDANSTFTQGLPTDLVGYSFHPTYDPNFVHVVVFNWPEDATATVDLSGAFNNGDALEIFDAQNIPTAYTNFTYTGGNVTLNLALTDTAAMLGTFDGRTWEGFDGRFRAFVVHRTYQVKRKGKIRRP